MSMIWNYRETPNMNIKSLLLTHLKQIEFVENNYRCVIIQKETKLLICYA